MLLSLLFTHNNKKKIALLIAVSLLYSIIYFLLDYNQKLNKQNSTKYWYYSFYKNDSLFEKLVNKLYISFSFTSTLGLGNIAPIHPITQLLLVSQIIVCLIITLY